MEQKNNLNNLKIEENSKYVWRYIGLDKFLDILNEGKIYFPTPTQFSDPNETKFVDDENNIICLKNVASKIGVSCWHMNEHENILMWKTYVKNEYGVAIKMKLPKLKKAIGSKVKKKNEFGFQKVDYFSRNEFKRLINSNTEEFNYDWKKVDINKFFFVKTVEYCGEQEYRIIASNPKLLNAESSKRKTISAELNHSPCGFKIDFDIQQIDEIVMHPQLPEYMKIILKEICKNKKLNCLINESIVTELLKQ
jgi:hypothetical protein